MSNLLNLLLRLIAHPCAYRHLPFQSLCPTLFALGMRRPQTMTSDPETDPVEADGEHVIANAPTGSDQAVAGRLRAEERGTGPPHAEVRLPVGPQGELGDLDFEVPAMEHGTAFVQPDVDGGMNTEGETIHVSMWPHLIT